MNILKEFDKALVLEETQRLDVKTGYIVESSGKEYPEYLHKDCWNQLIKNMDGEHKKQFGAGGGKELDEKDGKPPNGRRWMPKHWRKRLPIRANKCWRPPKRKSTKWLRDYAMNGWK